jgi:transposase
LASTVNNDVMSFARDTFARAVGARPTKRIVLVLDRAGYHTSPLLQIPDGLHLVFLPPYSPELQPAEHLWHYTDQPLVNQHFATIDDLEEALAAHCDRLQHPPDVIRSAASFHWWPAA